MKCRILLDSTSHSIQVEEFSREGIVTYKNISPESFLNSLQKLRGSPMQCSGMLPEGCIAYASNPEGWQIAILRFPELYADIQYRDTPYPQFPLPRLVFKFEHLSGQRVQRCWMGVVKDERLTPRTPMYRFPFANVSGSGLLCTGGNELPVYQSLHTLSGLPYYILAMPYNDDMYRPENNRLGLGFRELLEYMKGKEPAAYYEELLIPNGQTLGDFIRI